MSIYKGNKLIAGGPNRPDWAKAVLIDHKSTYVNGYTAPSNGMIVGWFHCEAAGASIEMKINHQTIIARSYTYSSGGIALDGNVQCPVNKGDLIKLESTSSISANVVTGRLTFVPFIDSYTGN